MPLPTPTPAATPRVPTLAIAHFLLTPLNLVLMTCALFFWIHSNYENRLFEAIVRDHTTSLMSKQQKIIKLREAVHRIVEARSSSGSLCSKPPDSSMTDWVRNSTDQQLINPDGACASFAFVFVRTCQVAGFDARVCHLMKGDTVAHVVGEVFLNNKWVFVDPQWNICFQLPSGTLASFDEISANWAEYLPQLEAPVGDNYVSYGFTSTNRQNTNWSSVPILLPATKSLLDLVMGKAAADQISLRSYFLNVHQTFFG